MSKNVVTPKSVSFEDALRNLASRLTGQPVAKLPRTQEGVVQFMAENVPSLDELAEAITMEVFARLVKTEAENPGSVVQQEDPDKAAQEAHDAPGTSGTSGGTSTPGEAEEPNTEAPVADGKPKRRSKAKTQK